MKNRWARSTFALSLAATLIISSANIAWAEKTTGNNVMINTEQMGREDIDSVGENYLVSKDGQYKYKIQTIKGVNYAFLERYLGSDINVIVPRQLDGYTVQGILLTMLFFNNNTVKTVSLPSTISSIGAGAFSTAYALEDIAIDKTSTVGYHSVDGVLYNGKQLVAYPAAKKGNKYSILEGTTAIQPYRHLHSMDVRI